MQGDINWGRLVLAAVGGFISYFAFGFLVFGVLPLVKDEYAKYPAVYRSKDSIKSVMPIGMAAMFLAILILALLYARSYYAADGFAAGARFGALIGLFAVCSFVLHNHVNLNIGWHLTLKQSVAYFVEWVIVGIVIGVIYQARP
jgi:Protein of unknown function (DUF1761)